MDLDLVLTHETVSPMPKLASKHSVHTPTHPRIPCFLFPLYRPFYPGVCLSAQLQSSLYDYPPIIETETPSGFLKIMWGHVQKN
jgi:hypothetical protein